MATTREAKSERIRSFAPVRRPEDTNPEQRIREKAYELFLCRGQAPGRDLEDWLEAERIVRQQTR